MNIIELSYLIPEISLVLLSFFCVLVPLFIKKRPLIILQITTIGLAAAVFMMFKCTTCISGSAFEGSFINNSYTMIFKDFIALGLLFVMLSHIGALSSSKEEPKPEFASILILSITGSFIAISARDLLLLFLGLELQSLPAYLMASFATHNIKSSEAGLKYFILGSLGSALFLFGSSFIYGSVGGLSYSLISKTIAITPNIATIIGASLVLIAILFKLSVVPFHMWTPDVYEGSPATSVMVFSSLHKIAAIAVLINLISLMLGRTSYDFTPILKILAIASLIIGALGGIFQNSVKRLMAYSTILNVGYLITALIANIYLGIWKHSFFTYIIIYSVSVIALFTLLIVTFGDKADDVMLSDLAGLGKTKKVSAFCISTIMFSMIGLPPLAGFFAKYYIIFDLINIGEYTLALAAIAMSLIAAFYYLKVIKSIYFDDIQTQSVKLIPSYYSIFVVFIMMIFIIGFIFGIADYFSTIVFIPK
ncbi:MAG: hypothetical protein RLZZ59_686 [Pseudomonadota bacterium]|jgi:NADH-quinone oxidoreductase subunit N